MSRPRRVAKILALLLLVPLAAGVSSAAEKRAGPHNEPALSEPKHVSLRYRVTGNSLVETISHQEYFGRIVRVADNQRLLLNVTAVQESRCDRIPFLTTVPCVNALLFTSCCTGREELDKEVWIEFADIYSIENEELLKRLLLSESVTASSSTPGLPASPLP